MSTNKHIVKSELSITLLIPWKTEGLVVLWDFSLSPEPLWCCEVSRKLLFLSMVRSLMFVTQGCQEKWKKKKKKLSNCNNCRHQPGLDTSRRPEALDLYNIWICFSDCTNYWVKGTISEKMQRLKYFVVWSSNFTVSSLTSLILYTSRMQPSKQLPNIMLVTCFAYMLVNYFSFLPSKNILSFYTLKSSLQLLSFQLQ